MRTKEQILEWLNKQYWKKEFYEASLLHGDIRVGYNYDKNFLRNAFCWDETAQGGDIWFDRDEKYQNWYDSENRPFSWEKYCEQNPVTYDDWYITGACETLKCGGPRERDTDWDVATMSKELCNAFIAYMKLIQLRNAWIKDENSSPCVHKILFIGDRMQVITYPNSVKGLSFSSLATVNDFIVTFKELLEAAKPLL